MGMREKYQRTLEHILVLPRDYNGLFSINYNESSASLGLTVNTFNRHLKKLLERRSISIVYKGGSLVPRVCKDIIMDADRFNDGRYQIRRNPNNYLRTIYSIDAISQHQRDTAILRDVLGWQPRHIQHFQSWARIELLDCVMNPCGLSLTTTRFLVQFVKYMVKSIFDYSSDEYNKYMEAFESLRVAHEDFARVA